MTTFTKHNSTLWTTTSLLLALLFTIALTSGSGCADANGHGGGRHRLSLLRKLPSFIAKVSSEEWRAKGHRLDVADYATPVASGSTGGLAPPSLDPLEPSEGHDGSIGSGESRPTMLTPEERVRQAAESQGDSLFLNIGDAIVSRVDLPPKYVAPPSNEGVCFGQIGCVDELPAVPDFLKRPDFGSLFTLYTPNGPQFGHKVPFANTMHYQLMEPEFYNTRPDDASSLRVTAPSWASETAKLSPAGLHPFDLSAIAQSGFNSSLNTRVIIGGYYSKENHAWIEEVIEAWRQLEPQSNVIKVSWMNANRGMYQSAAYNSRIVGRQLSILLHYLSQYFNLNLDKVHLVGHSLGAHIAGSVGAEYGGKMARITGLDPAGPIFVNLSPELRLDKSDAQFVDVLHTNGGSIAKGALGLSKPMGHIDYYPNGGSTQLGCRLKHNLFRNPLGAFACAHGRAHHYFVEMIKAATVNGGDLQKMPRAYSFGGVSRKFNLLEIAALKGMDFLSGSKGRGRGRGKGEAETETLGGEGKGEKDRKTIVRPIEFHLMHPDIKPEEQGNYLFGTMAEAPYIRTTKQCLLTIKTGLPAALRKKITLRARVGDSVVVDVDLDEIPPESMTMLFAMPQGVSLMPDEAEQQSALHLMWRSSSHDRHFRHQQQDALTLDSIEVKSLDDEREAAMQIGHAQLMGNMWYSFGYGAEPQVEGEDQSQS